MISVQFRYRACLKLLRCGAEVKAVKVLVGFITQRSWCSIPTTATTLVENQTYKEWLSKTFNCLVEQKYQQDIHWYNDDLPSFGDLGNWQASQLHPDKKFLEHAEWTEEGWIIRKDNLYSKELCGCGCDLTREFCFFCDSVIGKVYERGKNGPGKKLRPACKKCFDEETLD